MGRRGLHATLEAVWATMVEVREQVAVVGCIGATVQPGERLQICAHLQDGSTIWYKLGIKHRNRCCGQYEDRVYTDA